MPSFLYPTRAEAPPIELTDPDDRPFSLASLRGEPVFVFFGYTHCPDVCPATIGTVGLAMDAFGPGVHAVFVSVDPERDTTTWLKEYVRFLPAGFVALTGTSDQIRTTADAWGVRYARVETGVPGAYSMSHTADVYLVDANGILRARFPFGTESEAMTAVLREVVADDRGAARATTRPSRMPPPGRRRSRATPGLPGGWTSRSSRPRSGRASPRPVILTLSTDGAPPERPGAAPDRAAPAPPARSSGTRWRRPRSSRPASTRSRMSRRWPSRARATGVQSWRRQRRGASADRRGDLTALDPGTTAALGAAAPQPAHPTLDDVGGNARAVTTDPAPDLRLSRRSTTDALAEGQPFVLVIDSTKFRVSPACGRAIIMARYLLDRWRDVGFIHLEPYRYSVVTDTPVLDGSLDDPTLTDPAAAWGIGGEPWGARSMPWVFVVDGHGIVRAKYQGVMGSADVDVIVALDRTGRLTTRERRWLGRSRAAPFGPWNRAECHLRR